MKFQGLNLNEGQSSTKPLINLTICITLENWTLGDFWSWLQYVKNLEFIVPILHNKTIAE